MTPKKSSITRMADMEFRHLILARDEGRCRRCGRLGPLEAAHFVRRSDDRRRRVRWILDNAAALCVRECHRYLDTHPYEKEQWVIEQIGEERYRELRRMAEDGQKTDAGEMLKELRAMRKAGRWTS